MTGTHQVMGRPPVNGLVLVVDDDRAMCDMLQRGLQKRGFEVHFRTSGEEALEQIHAQPYDVVVADLNMPGIGGLALCERVTANHPELPVVVLTAFGSMDAAVAAIRAGGYDFISKPVDVEILALSLERAVRHRRMQQEVRRLRQAAATTPGGGPLIGSSPPMLRLLSMVDRLASSSASVLVTGETGTGKELVARELHRRGSRQDGPFVALNCAAVPEALLESELFGHLKGAFTDARTAHPGLFVQADRGVLFLDEVSELPAAMQPKLLRALQEKVVRPVGGTTEVAFDTRIIAATNRDLEAEAAEGRFRQDLLYRLNVVQIPVPPLRVRGNDVLKLAQHFIDQFAASEGKQVTRLSSEVAERLVTYSWPGNVRELQNCIERAVAFARFEELIVDDLPEKIRQYKARTLPLTTSDGGELLPLHEVERRYVLHVLKEMGGNKSTAARVLGLDRTTLYRKLERYQS
jgi:DNA-binding NtrC family response regulator